VSALVEARGLAMPGRLCATSLELRGGRIACLIGPNGSGKTSLLHALAGIGSGEGEVRIGGVALAGIPPAARPGLLSFMPASRDIRWPLLGRDLIRLGGAAPEEIERRIEQLALRDLAERRVDLLSTGERSRLLLARALAPDPKLLLLDEPLANLDPEWQLRLIDLLRAEAARGGRAALVAVHDLDAAALLADRLIVVKEGRIVADGSPERVLRSSAMAGVFGVQRTPSGWKLATSPEGPRSSP